MKKKKGGNLNLIKIVSFIKALICWNDFRIIMINKRDWFTLRKFLERCRGRWKKQKKIIKVNEKCSAATLKSLGGKIIFYLIRK